VNATNVISRSDLAERGFARYRREDLLAGSGEQETDILFEQIRKSFTDLPADPYAEGTNRYRRYGRAMVVPWERSLAWLPTASNPHLGPVTEYYQGDHNPDYPGARRRFPAIPTQIQENPLLREIILFDAKQTLWVEHFNHSPLHVGVHFVKLAVDNPHDEAVSSPNVLHQDGEPFTFAHLISRCNVVGGVNVIAPPRCAGLRPEEVTSDLLQAEFTLEHPLDSYVVYDPKVSHYLSPVRRGNEPRRGERGVLLIDFTPYVPQI
jgi:hypothetical protein